MMGCALNVRTQLTMNTGWHVTSATCGTRGVCGGNQEDTESQAE